MARTERTALLPTTSQPSHQEKPVSVAQSVTLVIITGSAAIACSAGLINFNKYLINGPFPYATFLVILHTTFCTCCAAVLYVANPSFFPALQNLDRKPRMSQLIRSAFPVAICFTGQLVFSNTAYQFSSVAFLQMMKEANVALVYVMSVICALEVFKTQQAGILVGVIVATALTVKGELHFSWMGFVLQLLSCVSESAKILIQGVLLSGTDNKLDPLSYVLIVSPLCLLLLLAMVACHHFVMPISFVHMPTWAAIVATKWILLLNACVAFLVNITIALFIKYSSSMAFVLVGIVKDAMIVIASAKVLGETISGLQIIGFSLQLPLILLWSLVKTFPNHFEGGLLLGLKVVFSNFWHGDLKK